MMASSSPEKQSQACVKQGQDLDGGRTDEPSFLLDGTTSTNTATNNGLKIDETQANKSVQYDVEHLATFSTASSHEQHADSDNGKSATNNKSKLKQTSDSSSTTEPRIALQRLFELEKLSGIWTQRMQIELQRDVMLILDCETNSIVERFHRDRVTRPEAFNHYNDIYNNIVVFIIDQQQEHQVTGNAIINKDNCDKTPGELHIFQCVSHKAKQLVNDILEWKNPRSNKSEKENRHSVTSSLASTVAASEEKGSIESPRELMRSIASSNSESQTNNANNLVSAKANDLNSKVDMKNRTNNEDLTSQVEKSDSKLGATEVEDASDCQRPKPVITVASSSKSSESVPIVNVSVKETVQVFNQIAALREKSGSIQPGRPLSETSSSSGQVGQQTTGGNAALSAGGQFYKQRSIRAILAPKSQKEGDEATNCPSKIAQKQSTSSSSSMTSFEQQQRTPKSSITSSASTTSQSDNQLNADTSGSHHRKLSTHDHDNAQESSPPFNHEHQDGQSSKPLHQQQNQSQKQIALQQLSQRTERSNSHTQSSLSNHPYNQHQQNQQQQQPSSGKGKNPTSNKLSSSSSSSSSRPPANNSNNHHHRGANRTNTTHGLQSSDSSSRSRGSPPVQQDQQHEALEQVNTNESYVSVLNHCFDDIEKFIIRLQRAYAAMHELQAQKKQSRRASSAQLNKSHAQSGVPLPPPPPPLTATEVAMLSSQARGPSADDFFEILSKFKLAFNLLAKLKGCIHEPNAPELVHFLFTPLAIIIESARNVTPPVDPSVVSIPYLNKDALDLLSNCCTSKESDLWLSLGSNWTQTIDAQLLKASRLPSSFQPIFSDGWAPVINELELIGLVVPPSPSIPSDVDHYHHNGGNRNGARLQGKPLVPGEGHAGGNGRKSHPLRNGRVEPNDSSAKSSSSSGGVTNPVMAPLGNGKVSRKRTIPLEANSNAGYASGYQQEPLIEGDGAHGGLVNPYRAPEPPVCRHHRSSGARLSMPNSEKSIRNPSSKHMMDGSKRNSDYSGGYEHYAPPLATGAGYNGVYNGGPPDLIDPYDAKPIPGYPSYVANPSDDYTELQESAYPNGHYLPAGPSAGGGGGVHLDDYPAPSHYGPGHLARGGAPARGYPYDHGHQYPGHHGMHDDHHHDLLISEAEREAMLLDLGPAQTDWFYELKSRGALIVRVLFTRDANNDKELTVRRGEVLEILDDTRKWWKARNIELQVAYVPHTIVAVMEHYQTLDELLTKSPGEMVMMINEDQQNAAIKSQRYARRDQQVVNELNRNLPGQHYGLRDDERNSKTAKGAFRYF